MLWDAGAVIHCKTNVSQGLQALDSMTNIFGRVLNPHNRLDWTAGGSSGGEGVLVAMKGCVMGVGTDVGGSIRIPAMCNGVLGFKPSVGRVPSGGQEIGQLPAAGKVGLEASVGPVARNMDDIALFMDVVERAELWKVDSGMVPGQWWNRDDEDHVTPSTSTRVKGNSKDTVIGVIWSDGVTEPLPPVRAALERTVSSLKKAGITVPTIKAPHLKDCQSLANRFFSAEGGNHLLDLLDQTSEPLIPWLSTRLKRKSPASIEKLRDLHAQRQQLQDDSLQYWKTDDGMEIDAIICPVAPHPVPPIDRWNGIGYTSAFVLLDYPAMSVPFGKVEERNLREEMQGEVLGPWDKVNRELCKLG